METPNMKKRKDLALDLLSSLKTTRSNLESSGAEVEKGSAVYYDQAFEEKRDELNAIMESYHKNVDRVKEINNEITSLINSWYAFIKDGKEIGKIHFPVIFIFKKNSLYKKIKKLNGEISGITINNRFIKEQLTVLEHQLEIKGISLARAGSSYLEYEKLLVRQKTIMEELKYLLPTIQGMCPADLTPAGTDKLLAKFKTAI